MYRESFLEGKTGSLSISSFNPAAWSVPDNPLNSADRFDLGNPINFVVIQGLEGEEM